MKHIQSLYPRTKHKLPLGRMRTINGERCILIRYTSKGRPQYRRPDGKVWTVYERTSKLQVVKKVGGREFIGRRV
jgi:hypothetical protein